MIQRLDWKQHDATWFELNSQRLQPVFLAVLLYFVSWIDCRQEESMGVGAIHVQNYGGSHKVSRHAQKFEVNTAQLKKRHLFFIC